MTTPLPDPPTPGSPQAEFNADCEAFFGALPQFASELNAYQASISPVGRNMLLNPAFQQYERTVAATADDVYMADMWYLLSQTGTCTPSVLSDPEDGFTTGLRITQSQASAQRFGLAQIIVGKHCKHARGNSGTLVPRIRCSASTPIRYAILGWTGTEDTVTSDVVLSWTSGTFTAGNFFNSTTLSVLGVGSQTPASNTWTNLTALTASLGSSFNNIIVFVWTENTQAQNVTLDFDYVQFEAGATATSFERRPLALEETLLDAFYQKIATNALFTVGNQEGTSAAYASVRFRRRMWKVPSVTVPAAGNSAGQMYFTTGAGATPSGYGTNAANSITRDGFRFDGTGYSGLDGAGRSTELVGNSTAFIVADCSP